MIKKLFGFFIAGYASLLPSLAQPTADEQESTIPIVATLDSLTYLLHSNSFYRNATYLHSEKFDFSTTNDLPSFPGSLIQERMDAMGSQIPLTYNPYVKGFIDLYGVRKRDLTSKLLTLSEYYFPKFEEILDKNDLPLELKYLSVVESALNPKAQSWAGASGLWQFIYSTGLRYGLKINSYVDERRDPYKATEAACKYFQDSYDLYGDWLLVIASYNCGPGNVNKAIRRSGGKKNFWEIQQYLPKETRGYVPAFIAVAYVMSYAEEHGIYPKEIDLHKVVETVEVDNWVTFDQLSQALNIPVETIYDLNPQYKKEVVPANTGIHDLHLPYEKAMLYAHLKDSIYTIGLADEEGNTYRYVVSAEKIRYKVKKGDNLNSIAKRFNVAPADIKEWNVIQRNNVAPGRYLSIVIEKKEKVYDNPALAKKTPEEPAVSEVTGKEEEKPVTAELYKVKQGDTLYSISKKYDGLTVDKLREFNNLKPDEVIKPGTMLRVLGS